MGLFENSAELLAAALRLIPAASQTFSKSYLQLPRNAAPLFADSAKGSKLRDVDGNVYIDFISGLLSVVLGYADPDVNAAVAGQLEKGSIFSLSSKLEIDLAQKLVELIPCAEMVRFGKNGSDVTAGAVRLSRAHTGRDRVACCGYHGWQDWYIGSTTRNKGVPKAVGDLTHSFRYNDLDSLAAVLKDHPGEFAAVIMEPTNLEPPTEGFLAEVKELAHAHGALLIFDEIITGFRWSLGGAQAYYGVIPDLATFGKSMANGFPISAVVGRRDVMMEMEEIFFSFTFGGDAVALAAALATIGKMERDNVIARLWEAGAAVADGVRQRLKAAGLGEVVRLSGEPPWSVFIFKDTGRSTQWEIKSYFLQEVIKRGILTLGGHNISFAHSDDDIERLLSVYDEVFPLVKEAITQGDIASRLAGKAIEPLFRVR